VVTQLPDMVELFLLSFFLTHAFQIWLSVHNGIEDKNYSSFSAASVRGCFAPPESAFISNKKLEEAKILYTCELSNTNFIYDVALLSS